MEKAPLETLSMAELQQLCKDEQLATYGTKPQMIDRLNAKAANALSPQIEEAKAQMNMTTSNLIAASEADVKQYTKTTSHADMVSEVIDEVRSKYPRIDVNFNDSDELFTFDGGRQGRVTTTARQDKSAILHVAKSYWQVMNAGIQADFGQLGGGI